MSFLNALPGIGAAAGAVGGLFGIFNGIHQNHLANLIHPDYHPYEESQYAKQRLGMAQQLFNGQMPGLQQEQQNIANSQANYTNSIERNATDASQALALQGLAQGQSNNAYNQLGQEQAQWKNSQLGNLNDAYRAMTEEGDKSYQSYLQKYMSDVNTQNQLRGNGAQNIYGGFNAIGANAIGYANYKNGNK